MIRYLAAAALGYLLGCSNMAFCLGRLRGVDVREEGSGNPGASNAMVLMGWGAGVLTAVHDIAKGALAVVLARRFFPEAAHIDLAAGAAAVLGHNFPVFLRFRGGKGFATYMGMILAVNWKLALALALVGAAITLITDYIAIATVTTALVFPIYAALTRGRVALAIVSIASVAVIIKHRENLTRILNGTEIGLRRASSGKDRLKK